MYSTCQSLHCTAHYGAMTCKQACMMHIVAFADFCQQVASTITSCKHSNEILQRFQPTLDVLPNACITANLMDLHGRLQLTLKPAGWRAELFIQPSVPANLSRTDWSYVPPVGSGNKSISRLLRPVMAHQPINTSLPQYTLVEVAT